MSGPISDALKSPFGIGWMKDGDGIDVRIGGAVNKGVS